MNPTSLSKDKTLVKKSVYKMKPQKINDFFKKKKKKRFPPFFSQRTVYMVFVVCSAFLNAQLSFRKEGW